MTGLNGIDPAYLIKYYGERNFTQWRKLPISWISTSQAITTEQSDSHIGNSWDGFQTELEKLSAAVEYTGAENLHLVPYPDRLRPLNDYSALASAEHILLVNVQFYAFSTIKKGSAEQNADVYTALTDSLATENQAYVQTRFMNVMPVTWQPNFFRPSIRINGQQNILQGYTRTAFGDGSNLGDMSIGELLPLEMNLYENIPNAISKIEVNGFCGQFVEAAAKTYVQRYPVVCRTFFTYV